MKRLQRLARVTEYLHRFRILERPEMKPILTVNQENVTSQLSRAAGEQLLIALPEGRMSGRDTDTFDETVSFAFFALSKVNGPARTSDTAEVAYLRLLELMAGCLEQLERDLSGVGTGAPCPFLAGLNLTTADVVPEYSIFGGWSGWYMEIVLE